MYRVTVFISREELIVFLLPTKKALEEHWFSR